MTDHDDQNVRDDKTADVNKTANVDQNVRDDKTAHDQQAPSGDYIVSALALHGQVRAFACRTTVICNEALHIHNLSPMAAVALGRLLTGVLLLTAQGLKNDNDTITAIVRGDGPLQGMTVVGTGAQTVRGYCYQPVIETINKKPGKLDIGQAVGQGTLMVLKDLGLKEPYMGKVELISGEIAEDLTYYLASSEQTPSAVGLGVLIDANGVSHAGGFLVQLMPDATDDVIDYLEQRVGGFPEVTFLMQEGFTPDQILDLLLGDPDIQYYEQKPAAYVCTCSRERMEKNLITLGRTELADLAKDPKGINLECHFCEKHYAFSQPEILSLLGEIN